MGPDQIDFGYAQVKIQTRSGSEDFDEYAQDVFQYYEWLDSTNVQDALQQFISLKAFACALP